MERNNKPLDTIRDGRLKITIWENKSEKGDVYHTMTPSKTYQDREGRLQDSHSFSMSEGLRINALMSDGRNVILSRRKELSLDKDHDAPSQEDRPDRFHGQPQERSQPGMER